MISYETLAAIWLITGCFNVLLLAVDADLADEPLSFSLWVFAIVLLAGPLLLVFALWGAYDSWRSKN